MDIQPIINNLTEVAGVGGAAIFDDTGHCIAHHLFPPYDPFLLWEMLRELRGATDGYVGVGVGDEVTGTLLSFEHGKVFTRRAAPFELVALTAHDANIAVLAVSFNVAMLRLHQAAGTGWRDSSSSSRGMNSTGVPNAQSSRREWSSRYDVRGDTAETPGAVAYPHPSSQSSSYPSFPAAPTASISQHTPMSWSQNDRGKVVGAVGTKVMQHLLTVTQRYFGRDAQPLLERELRGMGATPQTLTAAQFADVIRGVARLLPREQHERYMAEVLGDRGGR